MNAAFELSRATFADLADVAHIHVTTWQQAYVGQVPQAYLDGLDVEARQQSWEDNFAANATQGKHLHIIRRHGLAVGFIAFGPARDEQLAGYGEIYAVYVLQEAWGSGAGYALFKSALQQFGRDGFNSAYLWVLASNVAAQRSYTQWGGQIDAAMVKHGQIGTQPITEYAVMFEGLAALLG